MPIFGFFDYNKAGKGVAKQEPEKRRFFKFLELFLRKFWSFFRINLLYVLFCLPVVTIGPATVAMTQVMRKYVLEQPIFLFDEFWRAFKKNFKQGLAVGLFDTVFIVLFVIAFFFYEDLTVLEPTTGNIALMSMTIASGAVILMMHFYIYPQIAALNLNLRQIVRNSLLMVVLGIKGNLVTFFVIVAFLYLFLMTPISIFLVLLLPLVPFAWISFLSVFNAYPVIQQYIINPYYEGRGERNPEIPDYMLENSEGEDAEAPVFEDWGGREPEIKAKPRLRGKIIK